MSSTPAGWYPQPDGTQRYWDGASWTEHVAPGGGQGHGSAQVGAADSHSGGSTFASSEAPASAESLPSSQRPWFKKKRYVVPGGLVTAFVLIGALGGGGDDANKPQAALEASASSSALPSPETPAAPKTTAPATAEPAPEPSTSTAPKPAPAPAPTKAAPAPEAKSAGTVSQLNALRSAESYLEFKGFSKKGLIDQLSSEYGEGFPRKDAEWAVENLDVNWNEQAVRAGQSYLDFKGFSRSGLIDQLSSDYGDQFTKKQATYAADKLGL